jgi:ATP-dependent RNA helicase RhlE
LSDNSTQPSPDEQGGAPSAFAELGLSAKVVRPLKALGLTQPTPIQTQAIPIVLAGQDVMGLAQTGTGKTAAFGLPLVDRLMADGERPKPKSVRALILAPTRELVNQIADNLRNYVKKTPIWVSSVVGGQSINSQIKHLAKGTDILVATPGRLLDLTDRGAVKLDTAQYLVLDEADQMLDLGFIHALKKIAKLLGQPRQTLLFSATMPDAVEQLSRAYLNDPVRVEVAPPGKPADKVAQEVHFVSSRDKATLLKQMLTDNPDALSLVFSRTKHGAEKLMKHLVAEGFEAASIHGNKSQGQRDRALKSFRDGNVRILVATDVAARGIDIPGVTHVYNFNLPEVPEAYVHRIGRTARAGRDGKAVAFCAPDERNLLKQVQKLLGITIEVASGDPGAKMGVDDEPTAPKRQGRRGPRSRAKPGAVKAGGGKPGVGKSGADGPKRKPRKPRGPKAGGKPGGGAPKPGGQARGGKFEGRPPKSTRPGGRNTRRPRG